VTHVCERRVKQGSVFRLQRAGDKDGRWPVGPRSVRGQLAFVRGQLAFVRGQLAFVRGQLAFVRGQLAFVRGQLAFCAPPAGLAAAGDSRVLSDELGEVVQQP
jgi:hypothetical protein